MSNFILSCCSTADLTKEHFEARDIRYICFHYTLNGISYPDDLGQSIPFEKFYRLMTEGADTSTSQVNVEEYTAYFTPFLEAGQNVLHVCLSSGLSGSFNSANLAAEQLKERFPERKLYVVDSLGASSGYGLLMETLADMRDAGGDIDELHDWIEKNKLRLHHWFFSTDLTFYIKGGRVSKAAGFVGTILNICPMLNMDNNGKLIPRAKIRTKQRAIKEIVRLMEENAENGLDYSGKCYMCHSACAADAEAVASLVESRFKKLNGRVCINYIGTTIGSHTGPGTVALFFFGKERVN